MAKDKITFSDFLKKFPEVELPVTMANDTHHDFSQKNDPLSEGMIQKFILEEDEASDTFTEYIACFKIPKTDGFHAIVYWKAGLMNYEYTLATYDKKGNPINKRVIAGTKAEGDMLERSVATIEEDWIIYCVRGVAPADETNYSPSSSQSHHLELLATGKIIISD